MNIPSYFDSETNLGYLRAATRWVERTPFFANSEAPGRDGGIDCVHLLNWVYRTCGAIDQLAIPRQRMDHGMHSSRSLLIEAFETWPELRARFKRLWRFDDGEVEAVPALLRPGDALCFTAGRVPHHGGIYLGGGNFLHVLKGDGVHSMRIDAALHGWRILGQLAAAYRPLPR